VAWRRTAPARAHGDVRGGADHDGDEPIPCVILDISGGGAALRLTEPDQQCPTLFTLEPLEGAPRHCEVRWRRGDTLGVEFV